MIYTFISFTGKHIVLFMSMNLRSNDESRMRGIGLQINNIIDRLSDYRNAWWKYVQRMEGYHIHKTVLN